MIRHGWDAVVRGIHWLVAALFYTNYFLTESGEWWHRKIGWAILCLLALRIIWGLTAARGPNRLASFTPSRRAWRAHWRELCTRQTSPTVGHNPAGAVAIYLMWLGLAAAALSGWLQNTDWGIDHSVDDWHQWITKAVFWLTMVHLSAVALVSWRLRKNLTRAMLRGQ